MRRTIYSLSLLFTLLVIQCSNVNAQSWGLACGPRVMYSMYDSKIRSEYPDLKPATYVGLQAECLVEIGSNKGFPFLSYAGLSTSWFMPNHDTTTIIARESATFGDEVSFPAEATRSYKSYSLMLAYEFPQKASEFLTINYGGGLELAFAKTKYSIPEMDPALYVVKEEVGPLLPEMDNWNPDKLQTKQASPVGNLFLGIFYEFERFFVNARYHVHLSGEKIHGSYVAQSLYFGIYYPIRRF